MNKRMQVIQNVAERNFGMVVTRYHILRELPQGIQKEQAALMVLVALQLEQLIRKESYDRVMASVEETYMARVVIGDPGPGDIREIVMRDWTPQYDLWVLEESRQAVTREQLFYQKKE